MKLPTFMRPRYGECEHSTNCSFPLSKLRYGPSDSIQHLANEMKFNEINEVQTLQIHFEMTLSVCSHPEILLPWQRDVTTSPLYSLPLTVTTEFVFFFSMQLQLSLRWHRWRRY